MSATTTTLTRASRSTDSPSSLLLSGVLNDYELHHSGGEEMTTDAATSLLVVPRLDTPVNWDTLHRRVPAYRPINMARDQAEVRVYLHRIEQVFIGTMFTGVFLNAVSCHGTYLSVNTTDGM
jgi:hypothetical protein